MSAPVSGPVVSVVMIFLNGERFIEEAVASVLAQTYTRWELLFVDDGSTDRSTELAQAFAARHPERVRYLAHPGRVNRGMSASRNLGIREARGRYIAFLDCDDVWHPEKLARQVEALDRHPEAGLVYNATWRWFSWTGRAEDRARENCRPLGVPPDRIVRPPEMIPRFVRDEGQTPATCSVLLRREVIEAVGGFEESFRTLYEDQVFFYKVFLRFAALPMRGHWDFYRQHPQSCCHVISGGVGILPTDRAHGEFLRWVKSYVEAQGITHPDVRAALKRTLWPFDHPWQARARRAVRAGRNLARDFLLGDGETRRHALGQLRRYWDRARHRLVRGLAAR